MTSNNDPSPSPTEEKPQHRLPSLFDALVPIIALVIMLTAAVYLFSSDSSYGANQIALIMAACIALVIGWKNGYSWNEMEKGIVRSIGVATGALLILFTVGSLIGTWILAGTVPTMIYYGMLILNPEYFYGLLPIMCRGCHQYRQLLDCCGHLRYCISGRGISHGAQC